MWGDPDLGANASLAEGLKFVHHIEATVGAFAAIHDDGQVTAWGFKELGGDAAPVQDQLVEVRSIRASGGAFAATTADGTVVAWGDPDARLQSPQQTIKALYRTFKILSVVDTFLHWPVHVDLLTFSDFRVRRHKTRHAV